MSFFFSVFQARLKKDKKTSIIENERNIRTNFLQDLKEETYGCIEMYL
jgi:hypothetical protein